MKVDFTPLAERQLEDLYAYIADQASERTADAFVARIVASCKKLGRFPQRGTKRDDILPDLRTIGFERRVTIAFVVLPDQVLIEGVFYGGQDFTGRLGR